MITRNQLQTHLHELLQCARFRDYAPNGNPPHPHCRHRLAGGD